MFKKIARYVICMCMLVGVFHTSEAATPAKAAKVVAVSKTLPVASFTRIQVKGRVNVHLHTGYKNQTIVLKGDPRDLAYVKPVVLKDILFIKVGRGYPRYGSIDVDIRGKYLKGFYFDGEGSITGKKLNTNFLDVSIRNQGTTTLAGFIGLHKLQVAGSGLVEIHGIQTRNLCMNLDGHPKVHLVGLAHATQLIAKGQAYVSLYWVKSKNLRVRAYDNAHIQLAGIVHTLNVKLCDNACFNGRYLRTQRAFVKTYQHSVAKISAINTSHVLASDASNIYYYSLPKMKTDFMAENGSVLDMRNWRNPSLQPYTRYNK